MLRTRKVKQAFHGQALRFFLAIEDQQDREPTRGSLKSAGKWQESAAFPQRRSMLQCSSSFVAAQILVKMTSVLQKAESNCCSATSAAQLSEYCSTTSVFASGMLQGWGLEGWGLGFAEKITSDCNSVCDCFREKNVPIAVWLATGLFATENCGDLRLRFWCSLSLRNIHN